MRTVSLIYLLILVLTTLPAGAQEVGDRVALVEEGETHVKSVAVALATTAMLASSAMANEETEQLKLETEHWEFNHIAVVVADLERSRDWAMSLGLVDCPAGPAVPFPEVTIEGVSHDLVRPKRVRFSPYGEDRELRASVSGSGTTCRMGPIMMELSQPTDRWKSADGKAVYSVEHLENVGQGVSHIAYVVPPEEWDRQVATLKARGVEIIQSASFEAELSGRSDLVMAFETVHIDSREALGYVIELIREPALRPAEAVSR
jgi:catechol 2,3-dioxygenase-like lactoylglutathione lyase family enzyme